MFENRDLVLNKISSSISFKLKQSYFSLFISMSHLLYSFYTPEKPECRLHRVISDYYRKIEIDQMTAKEFVYLLDLLSPNCPFDLQ